MPVRRTALVLAVLLPLGLSACGGTSTDASPASPAASSDSPSVGPSSSAAPGPSSSLVAAVQVDVTVAGGKASGDTGRVDVRLGAQVRLTVTADVADEVHVHGFDLKQDTTPGQPATISFRADRPGVYEVELEDARLPLLRLQVQ